MRSDEQPRNGIVTHVNPQKNFAFVRDLESGEEFFLRLDRVPGNPELCVEQEVVFTPSNRALKPGKERRCVYKLEVA